MDFFLKYILPLIVFVVISGILGFGLAYLGEIMKVERDPRIDDVARFLPGINCGGCGHAGCDAFAEALVMKNADLNNCKPCRTENRQNIAKLLCKTVAETKPLVAVVHCNGGNKCKNKYSYQGYGDCQSAELLAGGNKACKVGCMGLGSCSDSCCYDAISMDKDSGVAVVDSKKCTSCGACVTACPKKLISRIPANAKVYVACSNTQKGKEVKSICENGCIACGLCEKKCPANAIALNNNLAVIDYDKCTGCGICKDVCPSQCILPFNYAQSTIKK